MEYPNYYYEQNDRQEQPQNPPRRGIGGYVVTAIVFTIIGALLATILMPSLYDLEGTAQKPAPTLTPGVSPEPVPTPETQKPSESASPAETPKPTSRPMPELDGESPVIGNSTNPIPDIVEQVSTGVLGVINYAYVREFGGTYVEQAAGSAFMISTDGYIVTNAHVVEDADAVAVTFVDGTELDAEIIGMDKSMDVAVLKVEGKNLHALKLGDSDAVRVGEFAIAIGDPTGRELAGTTTFGIIGATAREVNIDGRTNTYLQTDAAVNPGNSGGPLLNMAGEVIGITSAKTVTASYDEFGNAISAEGLGFAIPINDAMKIVSQLITRGYVLRPGIGVSIVTWDALSAQKYETVEGMLVYTVTKDGPADEAGLRPNDIIVEVDGAPVPTQDEFVAHVKAKTVGDTLELKVWRAGEYFDTTLTIGDLNNMGSEYVGGEADYNFFG
ncbi:MAG: trypsin-like peptidase domain-containing protein [bacterium]|nr:trypsin-like peptidase domain-containing protein [bacterium]